MTTERSEALGLSGPDIESAWKTIQEKMRNFYLDRKALNDPLSGWHPAEKSVKEQGFLWKDFDYRIRTPNEAAQAPFMLPPDGVNYLEVSSVPREELEYHYMTQLCFLTALLRMNNFEVRIPYDVIVETPPRDYRMWMEKDDQKCQYVLTCSEVKL